MGGSSQGLAAMRCLPRLGKPELAPVCAPHTYIFLERAHGCSGQRGCTMELGHWQPVITIKQSAFSLSVRLLADWLFEDSPMQASL